MRESKMKSFLFALPIFFFGTLQAVALDVGQTGPCVVLNDIQPDGQEIQECIRTRDASQKFTLIEFFSIACDDCQVNLPIVSDLTPAIVATTKTRLVATDTDEAAVRTYLKEKGAALIQMPVALDSLKQAVRAYDVLVTPTMFLLDSHNQIIFKHEGILTDVELAQIKQLTGN